VVKPPDVTFSHHLARMRLGELDKNHATCHTVPYSWNFVNTELT
jgi:hypothetical protein